MTAARRKVVYFVTYGGGYMHTTDIKDTKHTNRSRIATLWRFGKRYWPLFLIAEVCILVSYAISLLLPLNLSRLTDQVLYGGRHFLLPSVLRDYALLFGVAAAFNIIYAFTWQNLSNRYVLGIKNEMFRRTVTAKASFLTKMNSGDVMSRIDGDADQCLHAVQRNLFHFVNSFILCTGILAVVARINIPVAGMLLAAALLPIVITRLCGKLTEKYIRESREITGTYTGRLFEILKGFREIRLNGADKWAGTQVLTPLKRLILLGNRVRRVDFSVNKAIYLINLSASLCIYGYSAYLIINERFTVGEFLAIIAYIALLHKKLNWMLRIYLDWRGRKVSIDRVNELLAAPAEDDSGMEITEIESVELRNVTFAYDGGGPVLEKISLIINQGERVALTGASGIGKSTLAGLLMRLHEPQSGEILINGIPTGQIKPSSLRRAMGVVSQDVLLFDGSVRDNLLIADGKQPADGADKNIWEALEKVELRKTVENMPEGLDTRIGAASGLSGGEKQRLLLARLMLKNPRFIILDEATGSLDVHTEQTVMERLNKHAQGAAMLVIAHRPAAIRHCDRTVRLDGTGAAG